jgi:hypothetical protein
MFRGEDAEKTDDSIHNHFATALEWSPAVPTIGNASKMPLPERVWRIDPRDSVHPFVKKGI